jgi:galactokinase
VEDPGAETDVACTGPGRVNLIGDHTDYNQGLALPMAIGLGVTATFHPTGSDRLRVSSDAYPGDEADLDLHTAADALAAVDPPWARLVAAVASLARPGSGGEVHLTSTLPTGAGLSSSAALAVALADVFGVSGPPDVIARLCRQAEHRIGVPVGLMDPLVCAGGRAGHALRIDFATETTRDVPLPAEARFVVVDSGSRRDLRNSAYATRVAECEAAAAVIGPLGRAGPADLAGLRDPLLRRRARHVVTECARVDAFADALIAGDLVAAGRAMDESHRSLSGDFEVSLPAVDELVASLRARPGVHGARMTGAGFGGCIVVLGEPGALDATTLGRPAWPVEAVDGSARRRRPGQSHPPA